MSIASQLLNRPQQQLRPDSSRKLTADTSRVRLNSDVIWVVFSFALFIVLGPFAAIAVVPAVFSLAAQHKDSPEPQPVEGNSRSQEA
ncbi:MAG: hypothetical protein ABFQ82_05280 [Thermodesulfobacteriota bacterium]